MDRWTRLFKKTKDQHTRPPHTHDEQRILTHKRLAERSRERGREEEQGHDERAHVLGRLGERVLEPRDGSKDLAERDQDVSRTNPIRQSTSSTGGRSAYEPLWIQTFRGETSGLPCASTQVLA